MILDNFFEKSKFCIFFQIFNFEKWKFPENFENNIDFEWKKFFTPPQRYVADTPMTIQTHQKLGNKIPDKDLKQLGWYL